MENEENKTPPIIVKKKKGHAGGHGGAWKVAYADFVTAMMALFIVLWVLGQSEEVKQSVAHYFNDPIGFSNNRGSKILNGDVKSILEAKISDKMNAKANEQEVLRQMGDRILAALDNDPQFVDLKGQIEINIVKEGLKIELLDSADVFFQIGTAELTPTAKSLLEQIGNQLSKIPNKIVIEGHTDARPYNGNSKGYSNFELSADRANSARRALIAGSLKPEKIEEVRGYADRMLRDKEDPYNKVNRRISVIVKFMTGDG